MHPRRPTLSVAGDALASQPQRRSPRLRGAGGGGRVGRTRASPAPEPSLGFASHVNLERLVSGLLPHCQRGGVLIFADGGNPRGPSRSGTGRLHEGDNDNEVNEMWIHCGTNIGNRKNVGRGSSPTLQ